MTAAAESFRVAMTADFFDEHGQAKFADLGLGLFEGHDSIQVSPFAEHHGVISPQQLAECQGVIVLTPRVAAASLQRSDDLIAVCRFGVGYESVDVEACTERDVAVTITAGAVDRSMAEATIGWMIALTHHMLAKDRLVRSGDWNARTGYMGHELRDRLLGVIGLGGIGSRLVSLLRGFEMRPPIAFDPFAPRAAFDELGVRQVELDELLSSADFVSIHCPLSDATRGLIGRRELNLMKNDAYLINTARGGIVDEQALFDVLERQSIAGAAIDCFENEPLTEPHPFGELPNVILAPHSIAWTNEFFRDIGRAACHSMLDLAYGKRPSGIVNPEVLDRPSFQAKWRRLQLPSN